MRNLFHNVEAQNVRGGDRVLAWDDGSNTIVLRRVLTYSPSADTPGLISITFHDGEQLCARTESLIVAML